MINHKKLSKIIQTRESIKIENYLVELFRKLSPSQRSIIKNDMNKLKCQ